MLSSIIDQQSHYFELFEKEQHLRERERQTQMEHDQAMLCMFAQVIGASTHTAPLLQSMQQSSHPHFTHSPMITSQAQDFQCVTRKFYRSATLISFT